MVTVENKRILITGASQGLGAVCARAFSEHGARLVLVARSRDKLEEVRKSCTNPKRHLIIPVDLADTEELHQCIAQAKAFFDEFDVVLHIVGGGLCFNESLIKADEFQKLFTLNVAIAAEINRLVVPEMVKRKKGNLVHVGSVASNEAIASVGYNSVKAALAAYVRSLGNKLSDKGVVVTGILPGAFYACGNSWERLEACNPEAVKQFTQKNLPRKRLALAEEIVPLLLFLCSDAASMMTGCMVPIDAGQGKAYTEIC